MTFRLPRLPSSPPSHAQLQLWWQRVVEKIEAQEATQDQLIADLQAVQAEQASQLAQILAAQAAAEAAQDDATAAAREAARISSYPSPAGVLLAADVGSDCSITVSDHTRVYPVQGSVDVPDLSVTGATITGLAFSTTYYIYYDDTTLSDTTPAYQTTTTAATAQVGAAAGRHYVGKVTTPADGGSSTSGIGASAPGGESLP